MAKIFSLFGEIFIDNDKAKKAITETNEKGKLTAKGWDDLSKKSGELAKKMQTGFAVGATAITALTESTKEYREHIKALETSFKTAGLSASDAKKTYTDMYSVLGDTDKAKEATQFMSLMCNNQQELSQWTDICTGVYSKFGDALPIEGLTESANETAKVGKVTGNLADALNWVGISEDEFNEKLASCSDETERQKLIRDTLNDAYRESSDVYKEQNKDIIENNRTQAELTNTTATLAEAFQPYVTAMKAFLTDVLIAAQPYIQFIMDNINLIGPLVAGVWGTLTALSMVSKIGVLKDTITGLFTLISANPVVLIIGLIITTLILLIANWDSVKNAAIVGWNFICSAFESGKNRICAVGSAISNFFSGVMNGIRNIVRGGLNFVIDGLNVFIRGLNHIKIPDWVPGVGGRGINMALIGRFRAGLDYVPYDEMPAYLHKGERVLTAKENEKYSNSKRNNETYNNNNYSININVDKMEVKDEKDIKKVASELYKLIKKKKVV